MPQPPVGDLLHDDQRVRAGELAGSAGGAQLELLSVVGTQDLAV
ncbi:hypothetical protein ABT278_30935 [Streptomyces sp. NPDC001228]